MPTDSRPSPKWLACLGLALVLAGCGGAAQSAEDDAEPVASAAEVRDEPTSAPNAGETADAGDPPGTSAASKTAVVTIGSERYEFADLYCVTIGGALGAVTLDGDTTVDINIPPEDWETDTASDWNPPNVQVNLPDGTAWIADPEDTSLPNIADYPELSGVTSFSTDGFHASGEATFMNAGDWQAAMLGGSGEPPEPVQGTFEVTCPGGG